MSDMATPGIRFGVGRIIQLTFSALGRNAVPILSLSLAYALISLAIPALLGLMLGSGAFGGQEILVSVLGTLINLVPSALLFSIVTLIVVSDLAGQRMAVGMAVRNALRTLVPVAVVSVLSGLGIVLGMVLLIVPGILLLLRWWVAVPAGVAEGAGVAGSFSRSAQLTKGHRGTLFGLLALYALLAIVLFGGVFLVAGDVTDIVLLMAASPLLAVAQIVVNALFSAISAITSAVIYADLRRVKEGVMPSQVAAVFE